jgi:hypothetical protein
MILCSGNRSLIGHSGCWRTIGTNAPRSPSLSSYVVPEAAAIIYCISRNKLRYKSFGRGDSWRCKSGNTFQSTISETFDGLHCYVRTWEND